MKAFISVVIIAVAVLFIGSAGALASGEPTPTVVPDDPLQTPVQVTWVPQITYVYHDTPTPYPEPVDPPTPYPTITLAAYPDPVQPEVIEVQEAETLKAAVNTLTKARPDPRPLPGGQPLRVYRKI